VISLTSIEMSNEPIIAHVTESIKSIHDCRKDGDNGQKSEITVQEMQDLIKVNSMTKFGEVQQLVTTALGRCINYSERKIISDCLRSSFCAAAEVKRMTEDDGHRGILLITAYSTDYKIGELCDTINKRYSEKNKYEYLSETLPYEEMMRAIGPTKNHCTWYKVLMLNRMLNDDAGKLSKNKIQVNFYSTFQLVSQH
jgi:hypothetical protein